MFDPHNLKSLPPPLTYMMFQIYIFFYNFGIPLLYPKLTIKSVAPFCPFELTCYSSLQKVFPEAAAAANGTSQIDPLDLPSDDSEDDDFNPDAPEEENREDDNGEENGGDDNGDEYGEESGQEESSSDEDFYTDSDSGNEKLPKKAKNQKKQPDIEELPSEDSEDDDFDPERRNSDEESSEKMLNSEESDFTSDSDEFCDELVKKSGSNEDVSTQLLDQDMVDPDADAPIVARRQKEPTDYKKLYRVCFFSFLHFYFPFVHDCYYFDGNILLAQIFCYYFTSNLLNYGTLLIGEIDLL